MPALLSGRVKVSTGTNYTINNYITLSQAQAGLGVTPSNNTGYTLVIGANGVATFTNTLGQIAFSTGTITSQSPTGDLTLNPSGTGTITLNGPVNIPQGIVGSGYKKEAAVATVGNITLNTSTSTVVYDGYQVSFQDRLIVRAQTNPVENGIYVVSTSTFGANPLYDGFGGFAPNLIGIALTTAHNTSSNVVVQVTWQPAGAPVTQTLTSGQYTITDTTITFGSDVTGGSWPISRLYVYEPFENSVTITRATDGNSTKQLSHATVPVTSGTTYAGRLFFTNFATYNTLDADPVNWYEIVDSNSAQEILNKSLDNTTIGLSIPTRAQFTYLTATNVVSITNGTESTATNVGALVVTGGVGITKNLYVGGSTNITGGLNVLSQANISPANATVYVQPTGAGTVVINPATHGTLDNVDIGLSTPRSGYFTNLQVNNALNVVSTAQSTSTTTGAVQIAGGIGIGGNLVLGGQLIFSGAAQTFTVNNLTAQGQVLFTTSTNSTSTTTGGLVVSGGVGIAKDLVLGGKLIFQGSGTNLSVSTLAVTSATQSTSTDTGALTVVGGVGIGGDLVLGGQLIFQGQAGSLKVTTLAVTSTTNSTSTTTGAFTVTGGVGIGQDLWLGGNLFFASAQGTINANQVLVSGTATSTSTTTGALVVTGGVGVGKDVVIGGNLDLGGQLTFNKSFTATFVSIHVTSTASDTSNFTNNALYVEGGTAVKKDLSVYGNTVISGNLTVLGTQTTVDSQNTYVVDPVIDVGTGPDNTALTTNDGFDRGLLLHYNTGNTTASDNHAFLGRDASTGFLVFKTNVYPGGYENFAPSFAGTGTFGTAQFGTLKLVGNVASISTNTGDLQVLGGIGVTSNSYFAGRVTLANGSANSTQTLNHALIISTGGIGVASDSYFGGIVNFANITATSSPTTGAVTFGGGVGIAGGLQIAGPVKLGNNTSATSTTTGALQIAGGVGIQGDLYVRRIYTENGSSVIFNGGTISDPLVEANTAQSYSTQTGAVVVAGGQGIGKDLWVGGVGHMSDLFVGGARVLTTATPTGFDGGLIHYPLVVGESTATLNTIGITVNAAVNSVGTDSGGIVTIGGIGIGQDLHVGGTIYRDNDITTANWGNTGIGVNLASATFTDNQGSGSFTNTQMVYVGQPTFKSLFGSVYDQANTIFIEGAPKAANANINLTDKYAVWVNDGKVHIGSTATSATNYLGNALSVAGGIGIQGGAQLSGDLRAANVYDNGNRVVSFVNIQAGYGLAGGGVGVGNSATISITNAGVVTAVAGGGISIDSPNGTVTISNAGVTSLLAGIGISLNTTTGAITVGNAGVVSLLAGTDTAVTTSTGGVTVYSTATLDSITKRSNTTNYGINITSTASNALQVTGGSIFSGDVTVTGSFNAGSSTISGNTATFTQLTAGDTLITGQLTVAGTYTYVNSQQLSIEDPVIDIGTGPNNTPLLVNDGKDRGLLIHYSTTGTSNPTYDNHAFLGRDNATGVLTYRTNIWPGGTENVPNPFSTTGTLGSALFAGLSLQGGVASTSPSTGDLQVAGGIGVGGNSYIGGQTIFGSTLNANSTQTGAVQVQGGQAISKDLYVGGNVIVRGFVLTTATAYNGGEVFNPIIVTNGTSSTNTLTGALIVHDGGAGIGGDVNIGGSLNAKVVLQNGQPITTNIGLQLGAGLTGTVTTSTGSTIIALTNTGIANLVAGPGIQINTATFYGAATTVTNIGVTSLQTSGTGIRVNNTTGNVTIANFGVTNAVAGAGINVNQSTGSVIITNVGVYSIGVIGNGITATTSTGSVFLLNSGVTSLTAGTDTAVNFSTGDITVWDVSTLQSVTDRGNQTSNQLFVTNVTGASSTVSGALQVGGGVGIGQNAWVGNNLNVLGNTNLTGYLSVGTTSTFNGVVTIVGSGVEEYDLRVRGSLIGDQLAVATKASVGYGAHVDALTAAGAQSTLRLNNGLQIDPNAIVTVTTTTNSTSTTTGGLVVVGGVGIQKDLNVAGLIYSQSKIWAQNGYIGLNPYTIFTGTSNVTVVDSGSGTREIDVVVQGTQVTTFYNNSVYVPVTANYADIVSTGTIARTGNLSKNAWGSTGIAISVPGANYTDASSSGVVATNAVTAFGAPTLSALNSVTYTNAATVYVGGAPTAAGSATLANAWSLYVANGKVKIADATASNSPTTGALQVAGGVGISGDLNVDGNGDFNGNYLNVGNSEIYTYTSPSISSNATVNLDIFATGTYQSAKYFVQVVDNTAAGQPNKMYVSELIVFHDGNTVPAVYITEYGMTSNFGDLGNFDATYSGGNVQFTFTPNYTPTNMVIKVHRTTLSR